MEHPIVLCGLGRMGDRVLEYLRAASVPVVVVDNNCENTDPRLAGVPLIRGDCRRPEVLQQAGIAQAGGVLVLTRDDLLNVSTALAARRLNPSVPIVVRMFNQNLLGRLGKAVDNVFALSTSLLTAPIVALTALTGQALGTYRVNSTAQGLRQFVEVTIAPGSPLIGQPLSGVATQRQVAPVALQRSDAPFRLLTPNDSQTSLTAGDKLILSGSPTELAPLLTSDQTELAELRWKGWLFRMGRVVARTFAEMDRAVLLCTIVLLVVMVVGTVVFSLSVKRAGYGPANALFRTVSIMATAAGLADKDDPDTPGIRIFISCLRIFGAVIMAAFTALVTNYLLRARLGGALEVRRIPESGHVVVVGLSPVGFRVVEELIRLEVPAVVLEIDSTNRFISTARRLGAAVMIGDATVIEVLRQAHAGTARAVVPATNNDMTNLEVALLVRELNAEQRIVPLLNEPRFAEMLREATRIQLAVSVPALAAPAFIAGLYGDRVVSVLLLGEALYAVLDLLINDPDPLDDQLLRAVAVDYRLLPLELIRLTGDVPSPLLSGRLRCGDRLIALIGLPDLDRLLRRLPVSAECAIEVTDCPPPMREWLANLFRRYNDLPTEVIHQQIEQLPTRLASGLTRGQAEALLEQLRRERVGGRIV